MRSLLAATFSVNFIIEILVTSAINNTNSSSVNMSNYRVKVCNVIEVSYVNKAIKDLETKLENLITQNLKTNFKLENLSTQVNKTIKNLETKLENLEQRTIHQNLEMNLKLEKLIALINKTSSQKPIPPAAVPASSCKEQYEKQRASKSQVYELIFGSQKIPVYCHMGNFGCGDGGWTPAMKIDGTKTTFHYDSHQWRNRSAFNLAGGKTGFDAQETKLPTYWNTPFSKICLGMKIGHDIKFVVINRNANSLYSLIADGQYRATSLGRNTWKALIGSQASLQPNCNKEGFNVVTSNVYSKARIGILGNDQNGCSTCESRIGFGTGGYPDYFSTCGNEATTGADNGNKHIKAMGYILVQ